MSFKSTLKRALTLHFLLVATLPVLIFGLIAITLMQNQTVADLHERNQRLADDISEEAGDFLYEVLLDLQHVRNVFVDRPMLVPGTEDRFLERLVENSQFFEAIYILDDQHRARYLGLSPRLLLRKDDYRNLDFSAHALFQTNPAIQKPTWSDSFVSLVTGEPSVTLAIPLQAGWVVFGNISLDRISSMLKRYGPDAHMQFAIVDQQGTLIAHSDPRKAMQRLNLSNHPEIRGLLRSRAVPLPEAEHPANLLESVARIDISDWVVWAAADMDHVLAPLYRLRDILVGFMLAAVALASGLALLNARRLMQPLAALTTRAGQVAEGKYELGFKASGFMELDELAENFRSMSMAVKERETTIMTSEKRFRDLVNSIDGIVWEAAYPEMQFLFVSQQAEAILGYPCRQWLDEEDFWPAHIHPEDCDSAVAYCRMMSEQQQDHDFEYRMVARDGRVVWIRDLVTVVVGADQSVRLMGVMLDVTRQKEIEQRLRRSEQNYREIFNSTSDAIFIHDAVSGRIVDVNAAVLKMFGYEYDDMLKQGINHISLGEAPYSAAEALTHIQDAVRGEYPIFEWQARRKSGELFWAEVGLRYAEIGGKQRVLAAVRDVSERMATRRQLEELNERLRLLIDRMPLGCIVWRPDFTVELWNPKAEEIFGFSSGEMLGHTPLGRIIAEELTPQVEPIWERLMAGDTAAHNVNPNRTKDGREITCEWFNTPLRDSAGTVNGVISMVQDISARVANDTELERYRLQLEELVEQRTVQLHQAQESLVQKERLAVLGQLTTTVSHEVRNPLGTVMNALFLIRDEAETHDLQSLMRPLELAERNVQRCDSIISELLDFSKRRSTQKAFLEVGGWLAQLLDEMVWPAEVACHREIQAGVTVLADAERLRRAVVNVLTNALQALEGGAAGPPRLEILLRQQDGRCEIVVRDNGPGMSPSILARIFEPMFSTKNFGVGLGVPIIKNIMEDHGGGVDYQSVPEEGTTVTLWLPLADGGTA